MAEKKTTPPTHRLFVVKEREGAKDFWDAGRGGLAP
jgi:hypothetical protein